MWEEVCVVYIHVCVMGTCAYVRSWRPERMPRNLLFASPFYSFEAGSPTEPGASPVSKPPSLCLTTLELGMFAHAQTLI